jgi:hypothetical protein
MNRRHARIEAGSQARIAGRDCRYVFIALLTGLMGLSISNGGLGAPLSIGRRSASASQQPVVTFIEVLLKGQYAQRLIAGTKGKRYSINVYGVGFDSASTVVVNGQELPTRLSDTNELTARLSGIKLIPGVLSLQVVNADGQGSNFETLDVVTDATVMAVSSISKADGPIGTQVTLTGFGFEPSGNRVSFVRTARPSEQGIAAEVDSSEGTKLTFSIPPSLCRCAPPCVAPCIETAAALYRVFVTNASGVSTSVGFLVTSASGPIGVWGAETDSQGFLGLKVTVTDSQITVEGGCFAGLGTTTLTTDASGNFNVPGFYWVEVGPVRLVPFLKQAQFSGSISGSTMTLTITIDGSPSPAGPYKMVFGDDVRVSHPCV